MSKRKTLILTLALMALFSMFLFCVKTTLVFANSAQSYFYGVDAMGAIMADPESPIVVEKELLTLDLNEFPSNYYESTEAYLEYDGKVTAQYTFYNPSEYTVTSKLLFPFGKAPDYYVDNYDENGNFNGNLTVDDTSKYDITVDGSAVERKLRHTLYYDYEKFEVQRNLGMIHEGFVSDEFYSPDLTVTKYIYSVSGVDTKKYPAANVAFDISEGDGKTLIFFPKNNGGMVTERNKYRVSAWVTKNGQEIELFVIGQPFSPQWKFYKDGGTYDEDEISGNMILKDTEILTFKDLALDGWDETSAVSESDWYNAVVADIKNSSGKFPLVYLSRYGKDFYNNLMRWYEYEITFKPHGRVINSVTAPIYPYIDLAWTSTVYEYNYLLSPAKTWKSFGEIEIKINTPYYMIRSDIDGFTKTDSGYELTLSELPENELIFTLSADPETSRESSTWSIFILLLVLLPITAVVPIIFNFIGAIIAVIMIKK